MNLLRSAVRNRLSTELCRVLMTIALIGGERYKHVSTGEHGPRGRDLQGVEGGEEALLRSKRPRALGQEAVGGVDGGAA
jgi:hypothetical protein